MANLLKGALVGAIALGGVVTASTESSAMPVGNLAPLVSVDSGHQGVVQNVYWRGGWRGGYGWRRPWGYGWRGGWGWRRPYGYGYGWRRPWGWHYGWRRW